MTEHEKLRLRQHLNRAAEAYERKRADIMNELPHGPCRLTAANFYQNLAQDARDLAARICIGTLVKEG